MRVKIEDLRHYFIYYGYDVIPGILARDVFHVSKQLMNYYVNHKYSSCKKLSSLLLNMLMDDLVVIVHD